MQNQYVGDIGDFGKYGLLRALAGEPLRLGVAWYLFPDEKDRPDGKFTDYLCKSISKHRGLSECDTDLYRELRQIVMAENNRTVARVQESGLLPKDTVYHGQALSFPNGESQPSRRVKREAWLNAVLESTKTADVVFVDPDNGITEKPIEFRKHGPKYVFMEDLKRFYERGKSLVVYHHMGRQGTAMEQISRVAGRLKERLSLPREPWALWYHRGTARVYFVVPRDEHRTELEKRLQGFYDSPWVKQGHFSRGYLGEAQAAPARG